MPRKSTTLSELLHVCHLPACTEIPMNPFLHQLNDHADHHSAEAKLWLSAESAKRERVIFNYRSKQKEEVPPPGNDASSPKSFEHAASKKAPKKASKKFGSSHTAAKLKKFSLLFSPSKPNKKKKNSRSPSTCDLEKNSPRAFSPSVGIPELSTAMQTTAVHFDRICKNEPIPSPDLDSSSAASPVLKTSKKKHDSPVKINHLKSEKHENYVPCSISDAEILSPVRTSPSSLTLGLSEGIKQKNGLQQKRSKTTRNIDAELSITNSVNSSESCERQSSHKGALSQSHSNAQNMKISQSSGSPGDQNQKVDSRLESKDSLSSVCHIKTEPDSGIKSIFTIQSSPALTSQDNEGEIQILPFTNSEDAVIKSESHSPDVEIIDHLDTKEAVSQSRWETPRSSDKDKRKKTKRPESFVTDHSVSLSPKRITNGENHKSDSKKRRVCRESPVDENGHILNEEALYSREHLSYNFVLCDYVRECLALCTNPNSSLTRDTAMAVQQVLIALLFLRGAKPEFLSELCVCSVMKIATPSLLGTITLKSTSSLHEALELSSKEFQYLIDFVSYLRPVLAKSNYGCVFVRDDEVPFSIKCIEQAISIAWNLSKVTINLRNMLKSVAASYGKKS